MNIAQCSVSIAQKHLIETLSGVTFLLSLSGQTAECVHGAPVSQILT